MTVNNQEIWIQAGYETFALLGPSGLKVEPLAKKVGKSKSSFYHHFADLELFVELLLKHHLEQSSIIAAKEQSARNIDPELITILATHKIDLLFNRQLRIHQNIQSFAATLHQSNAVVGNAFVQVWVKDLNLQLTPKQLEAVFTLALENFFLQINADNLNQTWLTAYFTQLKTITRNLVA